MGYRIEVDSDTNLGLQVWLQAMRENAMDLKVIGEGLITGAPVRVSLPGDPDPMVTLVTVDMAGRPVAGGRLRSVKIEDIREVAVW